MQIVYQGRVYVRNRADNLKFDHYRRIAETTPTYSEDRARELLEQLLKSQWWIEDYDVNPADNPLKYAIVADVYDVPVEPL